MKMRFWQKTYILTLVIFLLCLNAGIFGLSYYTYHENVQLAEKTASDAAAYAMKSFERDRQDLHQSNSVTLLMQSYGTYYKQRGALIAFHSVEGKLLYGTLPEDFSMQNGTLSHRDIDGKRHIAVSRSTTDGRCVFVYAENADSLDTDFRRIMVIFTVTSTAVSAFLAAVLFFVLKGLSVPLERLRMTTEHIAVGDFSEKAEEQGNDEFAQLARSFNIMLDRINAQMKALEQEVERKQSLVDNIAHELRTPLTGISGYAEYIRVAAISDGERAEAMEYIINECKRLQSLSEKLLEMARLNADGPDSESVDLKAVAEQTMKSLQPKAEKFGVAISVTGAKSMVFADKTLLGVLMYNLTENAIKACTKGGKVVLDCKTDGFAVTDNGKGIEKEQLERLTEPFYRTDKARSRAEGGVGLGLSLCDSIVRIHGANMLFESEVGKGTTVIVSGFTS